MAKIHFIAHDGTEQVVDAEVGTSVMQAAVNNMVNGIVGDCGGCCSCATCHAYIDAGWIDRVPPKGAEENAMLEGALNVQPDSRLTCQIKVTPELDGLIVRMPESQY